MTFISGWFWLIWFWPLYIAVCMDRRGPQILVASVVPENVVDSYPARTSGWKLPQLRICFAGMGNILLGTIKVAKISYTYCALYSEKCIALKHSLHYLFGLLFSFAFFVTLEGLLSRKNWQSSENRSQVRTAWCRGDTLDTLLPCCWQCFLY